MNNSNTVKRPAHEIETFISKFILAFRGITVITNKWEALQHLIFGRVFKLRSGEVINYKLKNGLIFQEANLKRDRTLFVTL